MIMHIVLFVYLLSVVNAGGNKLQTTVRMEEPRSEAKVEASKAATPSSGAQDPKAEALDSLSTSALAALQSDVQPVGHDYVEEVSSVRHQFSCIDVFRSVL